MKVIRIRKRERLSLRVRCIQKQIPVSKITHNRGVLYEEYKNLVPYLAQKFTRKFGISDQDLQDHGMYLLAMITTRWDLYDGKLSKPLTWIYQKLYWGLMDYCIQRNKRDNTARIHSLDTETLAEQTPAQTGWFERLLSELSEEGRTLARAICESPGELAGVVSYRAPSRSRRAVFSYMKDHFGWSDAEVRNVWAELEAAL